MAFSSGLIGTFFYLKDRELHDGLEFVPLMGFVIFMIGYSIGFASVPYVLMGELFPNRYRNLLGGISSNINLTHTFLVIKLFTNLETLAGLHGVFWIYDSSSVLSCAFVMLFLPETKGKTLEEIEAHFRKTENVSKIVAPSIYPTLGIVKPTGQNASSISIGTESRSETSCY